MTVTFYTSADTSAPTLNDAQGALAAVLLAILVNGYGTQPAAGWTNPQSGTTGQRVFQQGAGNSNFLNVDDSAGTGTGTYARVSGYTSMTAFGVGAGQFPNNIQQSGGLYWPRFQYSSATSPSRWACIATNKTFYFWNEGDGTANGSHNVQQLFFFGDMNAYGAHDTSCTVIGGATSGADSSSWTYTGVSAVTGTLIIYAAANAFGQSGAVVQGFHSDYWLNGASNIMGNGGVAYPNPEDTGLYVKPIWLTEPIGANNTLRALMPGIWNCCHAPSNFANTSITTSQFSGNSGDQVGSSRTFTVLKLGNTGATGSVVFETSNTWS
jgi:hypothetical protein